MKKRPKGTTSNYNDNKVEYQYIVLVKIQCVGGIMVSIAAFQAVDPGSIPGRRNIFSTSGRPQQEEKHHFDIPKNIFNSWCPKRVSDTGN